MRTAPAVDRAPTVIATGLGLTWRILWYGFLAFLVFVAFVLVVNYWYVVVSILALALIFYLPWAVKRSGQRRERDRLVAEAHRAKYGRDPQPW